MDQMFLRGIEYRTYTDACSKPQCRRDSSSFGRYSAAVTGTLGSVEFTIPDFFPSSATSGMLGDLVFYFFRRHPLLYQVSWKSLEIQQ